MKLTCLSTAVLGAALLLAPSSGQAAPINGKAFQNAQPSQAAPFTEVRYRGRYWRGRHYHRHHHHSDGGAFVAGSIFGLATGAILGSAAAHNNAVAYCSQRFRSYDPASGTYLGYDGYRHPCP